MIRRFLPLVLFAGCTSQPQVPTSTSTRAVPTGDHVVSADASAIRLDDRVIIKLERDPAGVVAVPTSALTASGIPPLRDALRTHAHKDDRVNLVLDRDLPAQVAMPLLHTLLQSGIGTTWLAVAGPQGEPAGIRLTLPARGSQAADPKAKESAPSRVAGWANPSLVLDPAVGVTVEAHDRVYDGVVIPCASTCDEGWPAVAVNRLVRRLKLDHPRDRAIRVKPAPATTVQAMVTAMDASRDDRLTARGSRELFPTAVIDPRPGQ